MKHATQTGPTAPFDVVALVGSAGAHSAIAAILRELPADFPIPILIMQHLAPESTDTVRLYGRWLPFAADWVHTGSALATGTMLVCPPRSFVELLPNGVCLVTPCERGTVDKPIDHFLASIARSFGERAIGVVLTGMGDDGAQGARQLRLAGGCVLAQSEAEFPEMPTAAVRAGAAQAVLPVPEIAALLLNLAAGGLLPHPPTESEIIESLFGGEGLARAALRAIDWRASPLGPVLDWPPALLTAVRNVLSARFPTCLYWGPTFVQIYNEAYLPLLGTKLAPAGKPARLTWPELWSTMSTQFEAVLQTGQAVFAEDQLFSLNRHGVVEEAYLTYSYSPLHDSDGHVRGVLSTVIDTTTRVLAARRLQTLRELAAFDIGDVPLMVVEKAAQVLMQAPLDVPFALLYLLDQGKIRAHLGAAVGLDAGAAPTPYTITLADEQAVWPIAQVVQRGTSLTVYDLPARLAGVPCGPWPEAPVTAALLPLRTGTDGPIVGVFVVGYSPRLRFDPTYSEFLSLLARSISSHLGEATARQLARERRERLAELDQAKMEFFSNVSHEFRTPLTLLLAPLEELLRRRDLLAADLVPELEAAARNGRRLLTLVNNLLDFSQMESRRQQAHFELTDLCAFTTDIASAFRSAIEAAGLRFRVEYAPNLQPVWIDHEMWEKIVANLLSNAFKFTFEGEIAVELHALSLHAELVVKDTGIGIPEQEMPNLFKRFHRVRGVRARTVEGSGIGLSMVHDLVTRLGGQLNVHSRENRGTTFTIWIPYKTARVKAEPTLPTASFATQAFARELASDASRWLSDTSATPAEVIDDLLGAPPTNQAGQQGTLVVADDNADMRHYLFRLLSARWTVELASDGAAALKAAQRARPVAILADVMMPGLDGFALLQRLREDAQLSHTPVVLLTARAEEEAAIQGLLAGADDYIAKPFSPRELVARIQAVVERARAQRVLRRSEERQTFLMKLGDALRPLDEPAQIQETIAHIAMNYYGADRCYYCEIENSNAIIRRDAAKEGLPSVAGVYPLGNLPIFKAASETGKPLVVPDVSVTELVDEELRQLCIQLQVVAYINVPIMKHGQFVGNMCITQSTPRHWTELEVELAVETAERTWTAVERAHTEKAMREREERQRFLLHFGDTLRSLTAEKEILQTAARRLGEYLNADRTFFGELFQEDKLAIMHPDYARGDLPSLAGTYKILDFPEAVAALASGQPYVIHDVANSALLSNKTRSTYLTLGYASFFSVPLFKQDKLVLNLSAVSSKARIWTTDQIQLAQEVADRTWTAVERVRAETQLRKSEERQAFLLKLSDALRPLTNAVEMKEAANRLLGEHLRTDRTYYVELDRDRGLAILERDYVRGDEPSLASAHPIAVFEATLAHHRAGGPFVCEDALRDPRIGDADRPAYLERRLRSFVTIPLIKGGEFIGAMAVTNSEPRAWQPDEVALVLDVAERTWDAVQRARAEAALSESEKRFRAFVMASSDAVYRVSQDWQAMYYLQGKDFLTDTEDATPSWMQKYIPTEDQPAVLAAIGEAIRTKRPFELEHRVIRADGSVGWAQLRAIPLFDEHGEISEWFGIAKDTTERERATSKACNRA